MIGAEKLLVSLAGLLGWTLILWLYDRLSSRHGLPTDLPWAHGKTSPWAIIRLHLRSLFSLKDIIEEGYQQYSKNGLAFILPNIATGPEVVLPMSSMKWLLEQPDSVLDQNEVNREFLHADRTMLHQNIVKDMVHGRVIRREMTKDLDTYADSVVDEIEHALHEIWGRDSSTWKEVRLYDDLLYIVARISNRVLVGLPLCRDSHYLESSSTYARNVVITAGLLNIIPPWLRPICAPAIMAYDMMHHRRIAGMVTPIIAERARQMTAGIKYGAADYSVHNDYIQWALHDAYSHDTAIERDPEMIAKRLTVLSFAAIQSSVITATNCLFDIAAAPDSHEIQLELRDEVTNTVQSNTEGWFYRKALSSMIKVDSTLRESMRLWGFISRGVMKKVVAPHGIDLPTGQHVPYGSKVGVTSYAVHHDNSVFDNAMDFQPFRFSRATDGETEHDNGAAVSMVTSSDTFMGFSHGRHACPGRFFAANQLKLLLAVIMCRYDLEPLVERPSNQWLNNTIGPPLWSTIRLRRRNS